MHKDQEKRVLIRAYNISEWANRDVVFNKLGYVGIVNAISPYSEAASRYVYFDTHQGAALLLYLKIPS